jgi:hypothetical protein
MKRFFVALAFALFLAGCGAAPVAPLSPADLATLGPARSAEALTLASAAHDAARVATALGAAARCGPTDDACRLRARLEALESSADAGAALRTAVAAQRALAGPSGPLAAGPDDAAVLRRLGFEPRPTPDDPDRWCMPGGGWGGNGSCTDGPGPGGPAPAPGPSPPPPPPPPQPLLGER